MSLLKTRIGYKPFSYPWSYDLWKKQNQVHWLPEEVPMSDDIRDWNDNLTPQEKHLLTQIFRFFVQADIEVSDNYMERLATVFKATEVRMMLSVFASMEATHIDAYSHLIETIGLPEVEYSAFMDYSAMRDKHSYLTDFNVSNHEETAVTLAVFGGFVEGLQLFASFAMLMNFPRFNKMKGMSQIVTWSIRDESIHCEGIIKLFRAFCDEIWGEVPARIRERIVESCRKIVEMEDAFIDLAFEMGGVHGMEPHDIKQYIRYIGDWRLRQLGFDPIYDVIEHPLPWLPPLLNGVEHANFFEARATEYSKAASKGTWQDTWAQFDQKYGVG